MSFETVIDVLALVGAGFCLWWAIKLVARFLSWVERSEIQRQRAEATSAPEAEPSSAPAGVPDEHVAAIAAAVAVFCEGHKVVHIADAASGHAWAAEGRWMQQTSHRPH